MIVQATQLVRQSKQRGFDIAVFFHWHDVGPSLQEAAVAAGLPRSKDAVLLGNTRALWPVFVEALPRYSGQADPLDAYVEESVRAIWGPAARGIAFAHTVEKGNAFPIARLAEAVGLSTLAPCHLAVHPHLGPWLSLRAVVALSSALPWSRNRSAASERNAAGAPCADCAAPCRGAFERAEQAYREVVEDDPRRAMVATADAWIGVRDACPVGRDHRFSPAQLDFHYRGVLPAVGR